jgi:hypothetical protein
MLSMSLLNSLRCTTWKANKEFGEILRCILHSSERHIEELEEESIQ